MEIFKESFEGTWAINEKGIIVSRSGAMSGPIYTLEYDLKDINNRLYKNLKNEFSD